MTLRTLGGEKRHQIVMALPKCKRNVTPVLLVLSVLFPYIRLPGSIPDVRPEFVLILLTWSLLFINFIRTGHLWLRAQPAYKWFGLFGVSIVLSMAYAGMFKGEPVIARDWWEVVKVFLYFLLFAFVASQRVGLKTFRRYYRLSLILFMVSAFVGFLQYFNFAGINDVVSPYYAPTQMRGLLVHRRITGTTPNPNEFGALMVLSVSLALAGVLFFRDKKFRRLSWASLIISWVALVLTLSRTSLVSALVSTGIILGIFTKQRGVCLKRKFRRWMLLLLFGVIAGGITVYVLPQRSLARYAQLSNISGATSWQARLVNWRNNVGIWQTSPVFGWGPGKANMGTIVDNEWLLLLRRYGVVGLSVFLTLFLSLFFGLSRIRARNPQFEIMAYTTALQGTFIGYGVYMVLASVYHSFQLMAVFIVFLGLAYSQNLSPQRGLR